MKAIRDSLYTISRLPARKPLAWFVTGLCSVTVVVALVRGSDIQSGVRSLLETMLWVCVGGYVASSTGESIWGGGGGYGIETHYPRHPRGNYPSGRADSGVDGGMDEIHTREGQSCGCGQGSKGNFRGPNDLSGCCTDDRDSCQPRGGESP